MKKRLEEKLLNRKIGSGRPLSEEGRWIRLTILDILDSQYMDRPMIIGELKRLGCTKNPSVIYRHLNILSNMGIIEKYTNRFRHYHKERYWKEKS